jgi:hypothetical protein
MVMDVRITAAMASIVANFRFILILLDRPMQGDEFGTEVAPEPSAQ